jgi:MFS superfamily sulfate permease-like transporter
VIVRWNAPLFFANGNLFRDLIRRLVGQADPKPFWILVSAEPVTDIDTSAADVLVDLDLELNTQGIHLVFAEVKDPVKDKIVQYGLLETIDRRHFYPTIESAVAAFHDEVAIHRPELLGQGQSTTSAEHGPDIQTK